MVGGKQACATEIVQLVVRKVVDVMERAVHDAQSDEVGDNAAEVDQQVFPGFAKLSSDRPSQANKHLDRS
ncbi:MAG: hypothetical protein RLZZ519_2170 [Bacteroidota bacterium]